VCLVILDPVYCFHCELERPEVFASGPVELDFERLAADLRVIGLRRLKKLGAG